MVEFINESIDLEMLEEIYKLPATIESEPEVLSEDEESSIVTYTEIIDYTEPLALIHQDLSYISNLGSVIFFVLLISYFVPAVKSIIHKFLFRKE